MVHLRVSTLRMRVIYAQFIGTALVENIRAWQGHHRHLCTIFGRRRLGKSTSLGAFSVLRSKVDVLISAREKQVSGRYRF